MVNPIAPGAAPAAAAAYQRPASPFQTPAAPGRDRVDFGQTRPTPAQAQGILLERAYDKLRALVADARAELGIPEGAILDTSPEATANRIADFALGFFDRFAKNNKLADDEAGRKQFADFIGRAITKGIDEARGILSALNALNGEIAGNVDKTASLVQRRLDDFVANGR